MHDPEANAAIEAHRSIEATREVCKLRRQLAKAIRERDGFHDDLIKLNACSCNLCGIGQAVNESYQ